MSRKAKTIKIDEGEFGNLVRERMGDALPKDALFIGVRYQQETCSWLLTFTHDSFVEVPKSEGVPITPLKENK